MKPTVKWNKSACFRSQLLHVPQVSPRLWHGFHLVAFQWTHTYGSGSTTDTATDASRTESLRKICRFFAGFKANLCGMWVGFIRVGRPNFVDFEADLFWIKSRLAEDPWWNLNMKARISVRLVLGSRHVWFEGDWHEIVSWCRSLKEVVGPQIFGSVHRCPNVLCIGPQ